MKDYKLFINNKWQDSSDKKTLEIINPANGENIAKVPHATEVDVKNAVLAARKAFDEGPWPKMNALERGRILRKCADLLKARIDEFALIETQNTGKPITESKLFDMPMAIDYFEYYSSLIVSISGEHIPVGDDALDYTIKEPIGVIGAITPWNFPLALAVRKIAPALAAGNTMVIKPATYAPLTTLMLGEIFVEAGVPEGVINIVSGYGTTTGEAILNNPLIDKFSFTGSKEVGAKIMEKASKYIRPVSLELGGKSPAIVFEDADLESSIKAILFGAFLNQGEVCCAATRVLIQKSIHDQFVEKLIPAVKSIHIGLPTEETTQMGPVISDSHQKNILKYVKAGIKEGAKLLCGGEVPKEDKLKNGFFIMPTVFDNVKPEMTIYKEEIFGPFLIISSFNSEEDLIDAANDTEYGLRQVSLQKI